MAVTSGAFDAPGGTIELSNLGGDQKSRFFSPKKTHPGAFESRYSNFRGEKKNKQTQWKPWIFVGAWVFGAKHNSICSFFKVPRWAGSRTSFWSGQQGTRQWSHGYDDGDYHFWGCFKPLPSLAITCHLARLFLSFTTRFFLHGFHPFALFQKWLNIVSPLCWKFLASFLEKPMEAFMKMPSFILECQVYAESRRGPSCLQHNALMNTMELAGWSIPMETRSGKNRAGMARVGG